MRAIHIANSKKRDAEVGFDTPALKERVKMVMPDGSDRSSVRILKSTMELTEDSLAEKYNGDYLALGQAIIDEDPEIDMEKIGKFTGKPHRLYLDKNNKVVYHVNLYQVRKNPQGEEIERRDLIRSQSNINVELPVQWTGQKFPKKDIIKRFVFSRSYQIKHISGLTFDFLYDMAKELHESESMMRVGAGKKGSDRLIISAGGEPYFGFLEGRIDGDRFALIMHLTNTELKGIPHEAE